MAGPAGRFDPALALRQRQAFWRFKIRVRSAIDTLKAHTPHPSRFNISVVIVGP
jgi:hypothetical protein